MSKSKFFATVVELFTRSVNLVSSEQIYTNDKDNLYPDRVETIERNSPTAAAASRKLYSFIVGSGFAEDDVNDIIVNKQKNLTLYGLLKKIAHSIKTHRGAYIHVGYDIEGEINSLDVLDFKKVRVSKEDSKGYKGKYYYRNWKESKGLFKGFMKQKSHKSFYAFNDNKDVVLEQIKNDGDGDIVKGLKNYRGQVYEINLDEEEVYPYAFLNPALNDADSEFRISVYRNTHIRSGFIDKTIIMPNGLQEEDYKDFKEKVSEWMGAEGTAGAFVFQSSEKEPDLDNVIKVINLKGSYDSDKFKNDEVAFANNIRKAYLSIPAILIDPKEGIFGSSGEAFVQAKKYYNSETKFIRDTITEVLNELCKGFKEDLNAEIKSL